MTLTADENVHRQLGFAQGSLLSVELQLHLIASTTTDKTTKRDLRRLALRIRSTLPETGYTPPTVKETP